MPFQREQRQQFRSIRSNQTIASKWSCGFYLLLMMFSESVLAQVVLPTAASMSDIDLMRVYGAIVRANFRKGTSIGMREPAFLGMERELQSRGLVTSKNFEEIEQGIVYIGMPLAQVFAAISDLERSEVASFETFTLTVYRGRIVQDWGGWTPQYKHRETVLVCNSKVVGMTVLGQITFETLLSGNQQRIRTNFPPNHFSATSEETMRYHRAGRNAPPRPAKQNLSAGGWHWITFQTLQPEPPAKRVDLSRWLAEQVRAGRYRELKGYLERSC